MDSVALCHTTLWWGRSGQCLIDGLCDIVPPYPKLGEARFDWFFRIMPNHPMMGEVKSVSDWWILWYCTTYDGRGQVWLILVHHATPPCDGGDQVGVWLKDSVVLCHPIPWWERPGLVDSVSLCLGRSGWCLMDLWYCATLAVMGEGGSDWFFWHHAASPYDWGGQVSVLLMDSVVLCYTTL